MRACACLCALVQLDLDAMVKRKLEPKAELSAYELGELAKEAGVDKRSIKKLLSGGSVRGKPGYDARQVLLKRGLLREAAE
jgi:hypothetical protein